MTHSRRRILKWQAGPSPEGQTCLLVSDELATEEPLEIRLQRRGISVTLRTPGHDEELAAGFLLSEGLIRSRRDLLAVAPCIHSTEGDVINVFVSPDVKVDFDRLTRHVFTSSSCGLCGKATIDAVRQQFPPVKGEFIIHPDEIVSMPEMLRAVQETFARTGGLHAAGLFDTQGQLLVVREDIGRHNAVDKIIGRALLDDHLPLDRHILMVSGRASFEIMQKALSAGVPVVAAVSAPSTLAVDFADEVGQTLLGFVRDGRLNCYSHPERLGLQT